MSVGGERTPAWFAILGRMNFDPLRFRTAVITLAATLGACGLALDVDPPDPRRIDASSGDLGARDANLAVDGGMPLCESRDDCSDGDLCNGEERCTAEGCKPGSAPTCDDAIDCTVDRCDSTSGDCVHEATDRLCDAVLGGVCDAMSGGCQYPTCTPSTCVPTGCSEAACVGSICVLTTNCSAAEECCGERCVPRGCDDDNACTDDVCHRDTSTCQHDPNADACDDANRCTTADFCTDRACSSSSVMFCGVLDGNPCLVGSCDPSTGCVTAPVPSGVSCSLMGTAGRCDALGNCVTSSPCAPGLLDCDGDHGCECSAGTGIGCLGALCVRAGDCPIDCPAGRICCPATRSCIDPVTPSACLVPAG